MTGCPPDEDLAELVDGTLTASEAARVQAHAKECPECAALLVEYRDAFGAPPMAARRIGSRVGRFVLLRQIGRGAMGTVYAARDPKLERTVAVKLLDAGFQASVSEARALARIVTHPNVVAVHDAGQEGSQGYLAME